MQTEFAAIGSGMELSRRRSYTILAAIQLFTKLLQPSCAPRACRNSPAVANGSYAMKAAR
jgi:hypothetical protein